MNGINGIDETAKTTAAGRARPVWLLDVDGVINAGRPPWGAPPRHGTAYAFGQSWKLRWAPALVELIGMWHLQQRVEVRWATTWCPYADQLEALWGLPPLVRSLSEQEASSRPTATAAKLRAALAVVELERRPLVWSDDDSIPRDPDTLDRLKTGPMPSLLISPRANRGLSRDDLDRIDLFLTDCHF